jgi:PAS domain S-box-containing protein
MPRQYGRKINIKLGANQSIDLSQKMESYRQSNELYRVLVDQAGVGIFVTDCEYRLININSWLCSMFGYAKEELREKNFVELIVTENPNNGYELVSNIKEGKKIIEELWCRRKDNSVFLCELTINTVPGGRLQGIARDITKYRQTELALKESVARYQAVVEDQIELIRRFRPDGTLTFLNSAFCKYYGKDMDELLGQNFMDLFPAEDRETVKRQIFSLNKDNPVAIAERRFIRPNGEVVWQQWTNRAVFNESGQIVEYQSVGRDITNRKQVEQQLKRSEARFRAIVEDQVELIRRFNTDGTFTYVNGSFAKFIGQPVEEIIGKNFTTYIRADDREEIRKKVYSLTPENPVVVTEPRFVDNQGKVHWTQWVNRAILNEHGEIVEYQSVGRDITWQKEAELKIAEARVATERASRVATLAVIGGGIAHEINQPLNAIKVLAETILYLYNSRKEVPAEEIIKSVTNISRQVDRIDSIVNHLRSFLKNSQSFEYVPCDINKVVENSLSLVNNQILLRRIKVTKRLEAFLTVCGCFVRFEEVVLNLLMNAVQALEPCKQEQKEIEISTWVEDHKIHLTVSDNGPGIDQEIAQKIFEPFFSTKDASNSMGLGMSIVHSIVMSCNGTITVANNPSGGAIIHISFPSC